MLEKEFSKLGLNDNEREVYLSVLKAGKISPIRVASETGINRTTVYSIARKLAKLGLINEDLGAKTAYLYAEKPEAIVHMINKEEASLKERQKIAESVISELVKLPSSNTYSVPKIKFIEEDDLNDYLYKSYEAFSASGLQHDNTWWGYHDSSFTENYGKYVDWTWTHGPPGLKVRFFTNNEASVEEEMRKRHPERLFITLAPEDVFDSSLWVIGDYVIMGQTRVRPHYLVEINDPVFARSQRQLFKNLWEKYQTS